MFRLNKMTWNVKCSKTTREHTMTLPPENMRFDSTSATLEEQRQTCWYCYFGVQPNFVALGRHQHGKCGHKPLQKIQVLLKRKYQGTEMRTLPWTELTDMNLSCDYVEQDLTWKNIKGKDGESMPDKPITINEIFPTDNSRRFWKSVVSYSILVEGPPGCGKSTLALKLCLDWANKVKYICKFDLVLLVSLKHWEGRLEDMIFRAANVKQEQDQKWCLEIFEDLSKNILLILDDLEDLPIEQKPLLEPLLNREIYSHVRIIVLSRPLCYKLYSDEKETAWNTKSEQTKWQKHVYLAGIQASMEDALVSKCAAKFKQKQNMLIKKGKQIKDKNPAIKQLFKSPLLVQIIITLLADGIEPTQTNEITQSQLYKGIFNYFIERYLYCMGHISTRVDIFDNQQADEPHTKLIKQFGHFALEAISASKNSFTEPEILQHPHSDKRILKLGLLSYVKENKKYEAVHHSFLDFAAAYYLWAVWQESKKWNSAQQTLLLIILDKMLTCSCSKMRKTVSLFFPFLMGLMGNKAESVLQVFKLGSGTSLPVFKCLGLSLLQVEMTHSFLLELRTFIPSELKIPSEVNCAGFSNTHQHAKIIDFATTDGTVKTITWNLSYAARFPAEEVRVEVLNLQVIHPLAPLTSSQYKSFRCKELRCYFTFSKELSDEEIYSSEIDSKKLLKLIKSCNFELISCYFDSSSMSFWFPAIHESVATQLKGCRIKLLKYETGYGQRHVVPKLRHLIEHDKVAEVEVSSQSCALPWIQILSRVLSCIFVVLSILGLVVHSHLLLFLPDDVCNVVVSLLSAVLAAVLLNFICNTLRYEGFLGPIRKSVHVCFLVYGGCYVFLTLYTSFQRMPITLAGSCFFLCILEHSHFFAHVFIRLELSAQSTPSTLNQENRVRFCGLPRKCLVCIIFCSGSILSSAAATLNAIYSNWWIPLPTLIVHILKYVFRSSCPNYQNGLTTVYSISFTLFTYSYFLFLSDHYLQFEKVLVCVLVTSFLHMSPLLIAVIFSEVPCRVFACDSLSITTINEFKDSAKKSNQLKRFMLKAEACSVNLVDSSSNYQN